MGEAKKMKTVLLDVFNEQVKTVEIERDLAAYYRALDCDTVEMVTRKIGKKRYLVVCDENGLFRDPQKISAIDDFGRPMLVGNLLFLNTDKYGDEDGLSDLDVAHIKRYIRKMYTLAFPSGYPMLTQCEYC